jgi:nucleotide-binding universal stress UspA family protein
MSLFRSILCPIDFSDESQNALRWAAALALKFQGRLTVLHAIEPLLAHAAQVRYGLDLTKTETESALREFLTATLPEPSSLPNVATDVRVGEPSQVILETADRHGVDLIVIGTHGLGGVRKLLIGSTAERVVRQTHVPVLAAPAGSQSVVLEAAGPRFNIPSILAATDFSDASRQAIQRAAELAETLAVPLTIVHVVTPVVVPTQWQSYIDRTDEEQVTEARERLEASLKDVSSRIQMEVVVATGRAADGIASIAAQKGAGLIVLGLFGDQWAFAPRPGSVAYRVLSATRIPVLVVAPSKS